MRGFRIRTCSQGGWPLAEPRHPLPPLPPSPSPRLAARVLDLPPFTTLASPTLWILNRPPRPSSSIALKTPGESKWGRQHQSMELSVPMADNMDDSLYNSDESAGELAMEREVAP